MADAKISALPSATTPLAGTEVLPLVQSGVTRKVPVSDLTAGRAISATQLTVTTGNVVIGTSGQGIDFSATPGTGTSELFSDYEEGTFTPVLRDNAGAGNAATTTETIGRYAKIGRYVFFNIALINITTTGLTAGNQIVITGLPFTSVNVSGNNIEIATTTRSSIAATTGSVTASIINNATHMTMLNQTTTGIGTVPVSAITSGSGQLWLSGKYQAA